jgi:protein TonB
MAYLPLPSPSNLPGSVTPPVRARFQSKPVHPSEISAVFTELHQLLNKGSQPLDSMLRAITDAALFMTSASGIALALCSNDTVVCRACSGEIAPQLGGRLNVDSGISGECFRTGKALRCDDTQTDDRVDPEVCRILGIRSIAVVPVRGREGTAGFLEALSSRPHAFTEEHLSLLQRLAEIGKVANDRELGAELRTKTSGLTKSSDTFVRPQHIVSASIPEEALTADLFGERSSTNHRYWVVGGIALALILMSAVIWISLSDTDGETAATQQATQSQIAPQEATSHPVLAVTPWKPAAGRIQVHADGKAVRSALHTVTTFEAERLAAPSSSLKAAGVGASHPPPTSDTGTLLPPEVATNVPDTAAMASLVSTPSILPKADLRMSNGVTEATLVHNVPPVYPTQARAKHLDGAVILETTIAEDGSTRNLKIISGPPLLAKAAAEAVLQWRYRPSLLNGKPVAVQRQITIVFKNP